MSTRKCLPLRLKQPKHVMNVLQTTPSNNQNPFSCRKFHVNSGMKPMFERLSHATDIDQGCEKLYDTPPTTTSTRKYATQLCRSMWPVPSKPLKVAIFTDMHLLLLRHQDGNDKAINRIISKLGKADVVIIAGDIEQSMYPNTQKMIKFFGKNPWERMIKKIKKRFSDSPVIFVPGNHEYWSRYFKNDQDRPMMIEIDDFMRDTCHKNGVVFLNDGDMYIYQGVAFIGATMWTDLPVPLGKNNKAWNMNDFNSIVMNNIDTDEDGFKLMQPEDYEEIHNHQRDAVLKSLKKAKKEGLKTVVITHHPPILRPACSKKITHLEDHKNYSEEKAIELARAYCSTDLRPLIKLTDVWVYGHTHDTSMYRIGKTLLLTNGMGRRSDPNPKFDNKFYFIV